MAELLSNEEKFIINEAGRLWASICYSVGDGPTRDADLAELITHIHAIQRYFMGQAAARAYPDRYRLLGEVL